MMDFGFGGILGASGGLGSTLGTMSTQQGLQNQVRADMQTRGFHPVDYFCPPIENLRKRVYSYREELQHETNNWLKLL